MRNLREQAADFDLPLNEVQLAQFTIYRSMLQEWNRRFNLTAIDDPAGIQVRHFLDALTCATVTGDLNGQRLVDVGTGAGFPGLPLKILYPRLQLTLVESVSKKTRFLQALVTELGLENVTILDERAEDVAQREVHREQYDWAVARAVAELRVLVEYLLPFCRPGGRALAQKGESARAEADAAARAIERLGGGAPAFHAVQLPGRDATHYLVVVEKIRPTPTKYPRRPGRPAKRPL